MKKFVLLTLTAIALFAKVQPTQAPKAEIPYPLCDPCIDPRWW